MERERGKDLTHTLTHTDDSGRSLVLGGYSKGNGGSLQDFGCSGLVVMVRGWQDEEEKKGIFPMDALINNTCPKCFIYYNPTSVHLCSYTHTHTHL